MSLIRLRFTTRAACVAAAIWAACAPANAAIYTGVWDPTFGADFPGLGWRGSATFFVPDGCLQSGTVTIDNTPDCGGAARLLGAQVLFYDVGVPTVDIGRIDWLEADLAGTSIQRLRFIGGALSFLSTDRFPFFASAAGHPLFGPAGLNLFAPEFVIDQPLAPGIDYSGVRLHWQNNACGIVGTGSPNCFSGANDGLRYPATLRIFRIDDPTPVSAPSPAALLMAALAALALTRRAATRRAAPARSMRRATAR